MSSLISNSIARVIQHKCVGHPTYLDVLPGDVLQYCIVPFLGWEDRIHVNMLTPAGDRSLPNKIPKDKIIAHNLFIITQNLNRQVQKSVTLQTIRDNQSRGRRGGPSKSRVVEEIINFLQSVQEPQNITLLQYNSPYRNRVASKIIEFSDPDAVAKIPRIFLRQQLADTLNNLTKVLVTYPFIKDVVPKRYLSAVVWQNNTALLHDLWIPARGVLGKFQSELYRMTE